MTDSLYSPELLPYLDGLVPTRPAEMQRMEAYAKDHGFPIIGPASGYFCYLIAKMVNAKKIFELGSGYGYSTAWFCKAIVDNGGGEVYHTVWDQKLSQKAQSHLANLGYSEVVKFHVGEAVQALKEAEGPFDLIFNDIDKEGYPGSLPAIEDKLRVGGVLIVDNLLWSGKVLDNKDASAATSAIREFTRMITRSEKWVAGIVPIRDGLLMAYKTQ